MKRLQYPNKINIFRTSGFDCGIKHTYVPGNFRPLFGCLSKIETTFKIP